MIEYSESYDLWLRKCKTKPNFLNLSNRLRKRRNHDRKQVARRYQNQPKSLMFELLNEPHNRLDDERWQDAFPQLLKAIRDSNPDRIILIGPAHSNGVDRLDKIQLPPQDRRIIGTFLPLQFTRQGAFWVNDSAPWRGTNAARAGGVAQGLRARRGMVPPKSPRSGVVDTSCRT